MERTIASTVWWRVSGGIMTKPFVGESASEAMARHKQTMAKRQAALELMARQAARKAQAERKAELRRRGKSKEQVGSTKQPARVVRVGTSVRAVSGGLPSLGKRR
jgi:septal ring factor EnvC (AmiA/AmiB activator)